MGRNNRHLGTRRSRADRPTREEKHIKFVIITDGEETEKNYFEGLKKRLSAGGKNLPITVKTADTKDLLKSGVKYKEKGALGEYWLVFDKDYIDDNLFNNTIRRAENSGLQVGWSNLCFEIWLSAYFETMGTYTDPNHCWHGFGDLYQKKVGQEYSKNKRDLYDKLFRKGNERRAIEVAKERHKNYSQNNISKPSEMNPCSTVYQLVEKILEEFDEESDVK